MFVKGASNQPYNLYEFPRAPDYILCFEIDTLIPCALLAYLVEVVSSSLTCFKNIQSHCLQFSLEARKAFKMSWKCIIINWSRREWQNKYCRTIPSAFDSRSNTHKMKGNYIFLLHGNNMNMLIKLKGWARYNGLVAKFSLVSARILSALSIEATWGEDRRYFSLYLLLFVLSIFPMKINNILNKTIEVMYFEILFNLMSL